MFWRHRDYLYSNLGMRIFWNSSAATLGGFNRIPMGSLTIFPNRQSIEFTVRTSGDWPVGYQAFAGLREDH